MAKKERKVATAQDQTSSSSSDSGTNEDMTSESRTGGNPKEAKNIIF